MAGETNTSSEQDTRRYLVTDLPTVLMRLVQDTLANAAAKIHVHSAADITSGTLPISRGGTGQTTAAGILSAINAAPVDHVHSATTDITSGTLPVARGGTGLGSATENGVLLGGGSSNFKVVASTPGALYATGNGGIPTFGTLPVAQGGTGGATAANARTNLDVYSKSEVNSMIPSDSGSKIYFATCTECAALQNKVATVTSSSSFTLEVGAVVAVKFDANNTYSATADAPITLNVNNTGAKNIYYANTNATTGTNTTAFGRANYFNIYVYDGTNWVWISSTADNNTTYSAITQAQITAGTATSARSISAKIAHDAIVDLAGGTLAVDRGGTGATTAAAARTNLDVYSKAEVAAEIEAWTPRGIFISDTDYEALTEAEKKNGAVYYVYEAQTS